MKATTKFTVTFGACAVLACAAEASAQDPGSSVEVMRKALSDWTDARRTISEEREHWREGKQNLQAQTLVVTSEITSLEERIEQAREDIAKADEKFGEIERGIAAKRRSARVLAERIGELEQRARALLPKLPAQLMADIEPMSQRLPENTEQAAEVSLSTRYQNVIVVLSMIDKWNRDVHIENDVRVLPNGEEVSVEVVYVGLGQAYYVGGKNPGGKATIAGVGRPSDEGWQWRPANELAEAVQAAVAIHKNERLAAIVQLPVQIL